MAPAATPPLCTHLWQFLTLHPLGSVRAPPLLLHRCIHSLPASSLSKQSQVYKTSQFNQNQGSLPQDGA